eukprot:384313-Pelagomonas_calceolata.AAC.1
MTRASLKQGVLQSGLFKPQFRCGVVEVAGSVVEVAGREDFDDDPSADAHQWQCHTDSTCSVTISLPLGAPKLLLLEVVEKVAANVMVRATPNIEKYEMVLRPLGWPTQRANRGPIIVYPKSSPVHLLRGAAPHLLRVLASSPFVMRILVACCKFAPSTLCIWRASCHENKCATNDAKEGACAVRGQTNVQLMMQERIKAMPHWGRGDRPEVQTDGIDLKKEKGPGGWAQGPNRRYQLGGRVGALRPHRHQQHTDQ